MRVGMGLRMLVRVVMKVNVKRVVGDIGDAGTGAGNAAVRDNRAASCRSNGRSCYNSSSGTCAADDIALGAVRIAVAAIHLAAVAVDNNSVAAKTDDINTDANANLDAEAHAAVIAADDAHADAISRGSGNGGMAMELCQVLPDIFHYARIERHVCEVVQLVLVWVWVR
jgi:hypothetical protein